MKRLRPILRVLAALLLAYLVLLWPESWPPSPRPAGGRAFAWRQQERWEELERRFLAARQKGCAGIRADAERGLEAARSLLAEVEARSPGAGDPVLDRLEEGVFELGPMAAACPGSLGAYAELVAGLRSAVKRASRGWDVSSAAARDRLYRLLYGSRAALEEAMLQAPGGSLPAVLGGEHEPSAAPSALLLGIRVHSGDILLSRGGAPTSALIARGNDYPGNFSHAALAHVDGTTGRLTIVESHIERGVTLTRAEDYLADAKLRIMVLRPRADLPQLAADPMLPHRAAALAVEEARRRHIPYDFAMDSAEHRRMFCSEVAAAPYEHLGLRLWMGVSRISSPGLASWLGAFGVRNLETQEPSDLEYDPQLAVVAEWRDPDSLWKDHLDNAAVEAMLERAEEGLELGWSRALLPAARAAKLWSLAQNAAGRAGPVPEGMSATTALRTRWFRGLHGAVADRLEEKAEAFARANGYRPPYWELVGLASDALGETGEGTR